MWALRREESDGSWDFLFRAWSVEKLARFLNHDGEYEREQPLQIVNDFDYVVMAERDPDDGVWVGLPDGGLSDRDIELLNVMTESGLPVVVADGEIACPRCGGAAHCSTVIDVRSVPVHASEGRVQHCWAKAGEVIAWPLDYHCASCGARLALKVTDGTLAGEPRVIGELPHFESTGP